MTAPRFRPNDLNEEQRALYYSVRNGPRGQGKQFFALVDDDEVLTGPFNAWLAHTPIGSVLDQLGVMLRYRTSLSARLREMIIMCCSAATESQFEHDSHRPIALAAGVTQEELATIAAGELPEFEDATESAGIQLAQTLLTSHGSDALDPAKWTNLTAEQQLEVCTLTNYYRLLGQQMALLGPH